MTLILNGTDNSATTPAVTGTDTDTGIYYPTSNQVAIATNGTQAMLVDSSQNVGIGTASPSYKLDVTGQGRATTGFAVSTDGSTFTPSGLNAIPNYGMGYITSTSQIALSGFSGIPFYTNQAERMRIDSSGNLLVATTNSAPGNGSGSNVSGFAVNTNGTTWASRSGFEALSVNRVDTTGGVLRAASAGNQVGGISVTSSATAFNTSSDYRLKQDIAPMTGALIKVAALKPVTYKWKRDGSDGEGFIAHELAEVCPQAVTGDKDAVDADGNPIHQGIDTSFLVATLTAAIQELKAEFDAYKAAHP
jgi:hypothetical protein